jgi:hypothetical protein
MKTRGSGGIAPSFLTLALSGGGWLTPHPSCFTYVETAPDTHSIRSWVGPRIFLNHFVSSSFLVHQIGKLFWTLTVLLWAAFRRIWYQTIGRRGIIRHNEFSRCGGSPQSIHISQPPIQSHLFNASSTSRCLRSHPALCNGGRFKTYFSRSHCKMFTTLTTSHPIPWRPRFCSSI